MPGLYVFVVRSALARLGTPFEQPGLRRAVERGKK